MARIYSSRLGIGHAFTGTYSVVLPAGFVYVVRDLDAFLPGPDAGTVQLVNGAGGTFFKHELTVNPTGSWVQWTGRQVMYPGESLSVVTTAGISGWDFMVSGYQLVN